MLIVLLVSFAWFAAGDVSADTPRNDYMLQCQGCHLADGGGSYAAGTDEIGGVPSLRGFVGRFLAVPGGREYLIRVPGGAQSPLSDAELAAVLNWMIREFDPEAVSQDFIPFGAQEVARHRRPLVDVETVRRALLRRIGSPDAGAGLRSSASHRWARATGR